MTFSSSFFHKKRRVAVAVAATIAAVVGTGLSLARGWLFGNRRRRRKPPLHPRRRQPASPPWRHAT
jgi:membrane protein DedA with SNARE-associated domain